MIRRKKEKLAQGAGRSQRLCCGGAGAHTRSPPRAPFLAAGTLEEYTSRLSGLELVKNQQLADVDKQFEQEMERLRKLHEYERRAAEQSFLVRNARNPGYHTPGAAWTAQRARR